MTIGVDASRANCHQLTGTERYAFEVLRRLPGLRPDVHWRFYVRESLHPRWGQLPRNVEVYILGWPPKLLWTHIRLAWEVLWRRPDVLFVPVGAVPLWPRLPSATTIHDIAFERFPELYRTPLVRVPRLLKNLLTIIVRLITGGRYGLSQLDYQRWAVRRALQVEIILTVSEFTKQECQQQYTVDGQRFFVTPLGVDRGSPLSPSDRHEVLTRYGLSQPFLIFIGRLETKKNIDGILRAYVAWRQTHHDKLDLVLVGPTGQGWEEHRRLIPQDWIGRSVHLLGFVDGDDQRTLLASAECLLYVSRYEGFGLVPLEAMAVDVPVIAAQAASLPEVVGSAALLVDPEQPQRITEAISKIHTNSDLRQNLVTAGRERIRRFSWDHTAELTAAALDQLAGLRGQQKSGRVKAA